MSIRTRGNSVASAAWVHVDHVIAVPRGERFRDSKYPTEVVQVFRSQTYAELPFEIDNTFRRALKLAVAELGIDVLDRTIHPSKKLLMCIREKFEDEANAV